MPKLEPENIDWKAKVIHGKRCVICGTRVIDDFGKPTNVRQGKGYGSDKIFCRKCGLIVATLKKKAKTERKQEP